MLEQARSAICSQHANYHHIFLLQSKMLLCIYMYVVLVHIIIQTPKTSKCQRNSTHTVSFLALPPGPCPTCKILLGCYFSDVAVLFFQNVQSNRKVTLSKRPIGSHRNTYFPLYRVCSRSVITCSAFAKEIAVFVTLQIP